MRTLLTRDPREAADVARRGGVAAFPTETVYGLAASAFDPEAIAKIFVAKDRPPDNPLIAHISHLYQIERLADTLSLFARKLIESFFPGPLTVVVRKSAAVPPLATAGLDTIGVRMPDHDLARQFIAACGVPVVAPSANLSGRPSPTTWQAVLEDLDGRIECILQGELSQIGIESTVVDCTAEVPLILRPGSISIDEVRAIVPSARLHIPGPDDVARSPGLRHRHYSPRARVVIVGKGEDVYPIKSQLAAYIGLSEPVFRVKVSRMFESVEGYARSLYEFFRECDRKGIEVIHCEAVDEGGVGSALMDRLRRAAKE